MGNNELDILLLDDSKLPNVKLPESHVLFEMSLFKQKHVDSSLGLSTMLFVDQVILKPDRENNTLNF